MEGRFVTISKTVPQNSKVIMSIREAVSSIKEQLPNRPYKLMRVYVWKKEMSGLEARIEDTNVILEYLSGLCIPDQTIEVSFLV